MNRMKVTAPYQVPNEIKVHGATAPDGRPYIAVTASGKTAWLSRDTFTGGEQTALNKLKAMGIPLLSKEWACAKDAVATLIDFPVLPLINRTGWSGAHFAMVDGKVFSPKGSTKSVILYPPDQQRVKKAGSLKHWRELTAELSGQHVATFVLLTAFAGPLISISGHYANIGFEIAGPGGTGKSTLLRLAAAAYGPVDNAQGPNYWMTANATMNGLEGVLAEHNDMSLIIDETNQYAASDNFAMRAAKFNELVFKLADGSEKRRYLGNAPTRSRFAFLTSTNEPLGRLLEGHSVQVADAAADRLLTIEIDAEREFGVFDWLPRKWSDAACFADFINCEIRKVHGVAIRRFLQRLVRERSADPAAFKKRVRDAMNDFRTSVAVDKNNGSETRVADSFGLIAAAGDLAIEYGAVSKKLEPFLAATHCYYANRKVNRTSVDRAKALRSLAVT